MQGFEVATERQLFGSSDACTMRSSGFTTHTWVKRRARESASRSRWSIVSLGPCRADPCSARKNKQEMNRHSHHINPSLELSVTCLIPLLARGLGESDK